MRDIYSQLWGSPISSKTLKWPRHRTTIDVGFLLLLFLTSDRIFCCFSNFRTVSDSLTTPSRPFSPQNKPHNWRKVRILFILFEENDKTFKYVKHVSCVQLIKVQSVGSWMKVWELKDNLRLKWRNCWFKEVCSLWIWITSWVENR